MSKSHVRIENVTFSRGSRRIFDGVSLEIPRGKVVAIMGPSGSGKTTMLRLIGGQLKPATGKVWVEDKCVSRLTRTQLFALRRNMGMLFQSGALFTDISVFDNVAFPLRIHTDLPEEMIRDLVLIKLQAVGLRGASALFPAELSGGMNRRVALARSIALDPSMMMYDEPFTGLDPIAMGVVVQLIRTLNRVFGTTSIIVSHDLQETASIADIIYVIADGKLIGAGSPEELFNADSPRVQQFIKGLPDGPVPFHYPARDFETELLEGDDL
ncbi:MAG: phospholipid/cholesterol/gamma-HCH transport system ATP-binding protein [Candidatus Azotimanducaceae bacterium]|jgi:phospholipid/cholesterol/gamma-HCH transport system ATP-binding protein